MRHKSNNPVALMLTAGLALAATAGPASAQYALGEGRSLDSNLRSGSAGYNQAFGPGAGRALDNNLNTRSGGYNGVGRNFGAEVAFRNAIVTGNVGGGREFRGSVGYTAADDFRGFLGSNTNFQFERDSFYSGLATRNLAGIDAIRNPLAYTVAGQTDSVFGGPLIINRSGAAASGNTVTPNAPQQRSTDVFGNIAGTLRAPSMSITRVDRMPEMLAYSGEPDSTGARQIMSASPLMGIRSLRSDGPSFNPGDPGNSTLTRMGIVQPGPDELLADGDEPFGEEITRSPHQVVLESLRGPEQALPFGAVPLGSPALDPDAEPADPLKPSTTIVPPDSGEVDGEPASNPLVPVFDQSLDNLRAMLLDNREERMAADIAAREELESAQAEEEIEEDEESAEDRKPAKTAPELAAEILKGKSALIIDLAVPPSAGTIFAQHMRRGQELLAQERWFDAEERFTAALNMRPGDPIAAAARVVAQIAGGMYRSASVNLRNLFQAYPEMMVTRFDLNLVGPSKRTDRVKAQLRQRAEGETQLAREASLLLAYVAFQTEDEPTMVQAFTRLDEIAAIRDSEPDTLEQTLRAVWLTSPQPPAQSPTPAPAPAPAP